MIRLIKRYQNRKYYDEREAAYITLNQIFELVRNGEEVSVVDFSEQRPKNITSEVLLKVIMDQENKRVDLLDTETLKTVIKAGDGTLSGFITMQNTSNS